MRDDKTAYRVTELLIDLVPRGLPREFSTAHGWAYGGHLWRDRDGWHGQALPGETTNRPAAIAEILNELE